MVRKILWFAGLYGILLVGTAIMVASLGGSVWDPKLGWAELGGVFALLLVLAAVGSGWAFAAFGRFDKTVATAVTIGGVALTLLVGVVGLVWMADPLKAVLTSTTLCWALGTAALTVIAWLWPRGR